MENKLVDIAKNSNAWPFQEALRILKSLNGKTPEKGYVLFETGYGPSGLPHIGTFGEVARTILVKNAFNLICDIPTKLITFSDDMDGFRKVPDNVPNQEMLKLHIDKPLSNVPDPFEKYNSFAEHNNERLKSFLDKFNFEYEFKSSTDCYLNGDFDKSLLSILKNYETILEIILPTLGKDRRETYSPFLPLCEETGKVLQVPINNINLNNGTIEYTNENGKNIITEVTKGKCKLQWKADWAMRWAALDVNYEMNGKDLTPSFDLSKKIVQTIGGKPPVNMVYELFLDQNGEKISKSKGNGLSIEEWLSYGTEESLTLYMYQNPKRAKRLYFDTIPKNVDEYSRFLSSSKNQDIESLVKNPVWHIHNGNIPEHNQEVSYSMLLNLASVCNANSSEILWGFIAKYTNDNNKSDPLMNNLIEKALQYYKDFIAPNKKYKKPNENEIIALQSLNKRLIKLNNSSDSEEIQSEVYETGKEHNYEELKEWFSTLYEILLGQTQGPRIGSFIALYGCNETIELINKAIKGELTN
ncbi:MAG: lysine--tRNA ligase [Alphaproteobacteria bacterium]